MEMYKKISLITNENDLSDILDEFCDRFGEPPKATVRLLDIALLRSYASKGKIQKVVCKDGEVRFVQDKINLPVWSEVFSRIEGIRFTSALSPAIVYKLRRGEDAVSMARKIISEYYNTLVSEKEGKNEQN